MISASHVLDLVMKFQLPILESSTRFLSQIQAMWTFLLHTKYQETPAKPPDSHLAQLSLYSNTTHVKNCLLIYVGKSQTPPSYPMEGDIIVHVISFDLAALNEKEFKSKCDDFMNEIKKILDSLHNKN